MNSINVSLLGNCIAKASGLCIISKATDAPIHKFNACDRSTGKSNNPEDKAFMSKHKMKFCLPTDSYAGTHKYYDSLGGTVPTTAELGAIANYIYHDETTTKLDTIKASEQGISSGIYVWAAKEYRGHSWAAKVQCFDFDNTYSTQHYRYNSGYKVVCLGD